MKSILLNFVKTKIWQLVVFFLLILISSWNLQRVFWKNDMRYLFEDLLFLIIAIPFFSYFWSKWRFWEKIEGFFIWWGISIVLYITYILVFNSIYWDSFIPIVAIFWSIYMLLFSPLIVLFFFIIHKWSENKALIVNQENPLASTKPKKSIINQGNTNRTSTAFLVNEKTIISQNKEEQINITDNKEYPFEYRIMYNALSWIYYLVLSFVLFIIFLVWWWESFNRNLFGTIISVWILIGCVYFVRTVFKIFKSIINDIPAFIIDNKWIFIGSTKEKYSWKDISWEYIHIYKTNWNLIFTYQEGKKIFSLEWIWIFTAKYTLKKVLAIYRRRSWYIYIVPDISTSYVSGNIIPINE